MEFMIIEFGFSRCGTLDVFNGDTNEKLNLALVTKFRHVRRIVDIILCRLGPSANED